RPDSHRSRGTAKSKLAPACATSAGSGCGLCGVASAIWLVAASQAQVQPILAVRHGGNGLQRGLKRTFRQAVFPGKVYRVRFEQTVVGQQFYGCEVAVRNIFGPLVAANMIADGAQA